MFFFYDEIEKESRVKADAGVRIKGAYNLKETPITEYEVTCPYGDIVLIIGMLRDYVRCLDRVMGDDVQYKAYYRNRFLKMADRLQTQIDYDYDAAIERCNKKRKKENRDDVGEDALVLALKRGAKKGREEKSEHDQN